MFKIRNYWHAISREEILRCLQLLDREYSEMDYTIEIYKNRKRMEYEQKYRPDLDEINYIEILNPSIGKTPTGICLSERRLIKMFPFNIKSPYPKIILIYHLIHEIRHAWQHSYANETFNEEFVGALENGFDDYLNNPAERDAYIFARDFMNSRKEQVCAALNIPSAAIGEFSVKFTD